MLLAEDIKTKDLVDTASYTNTARFARVIKVYDADNYDENYGKVELVWLDTQIPVSGLVDVIDNSVSVIYGCGIFAMPNVGDIAVCLPQNNGAPLILGFVHPDKFKATNASRDNIELLSNLPRLRAGEYFIKGRSQSSILFKNDGTVNITAKNGSTLNEVKPQTQKGAYVNTDPIYKVSAAETNTVFELTVGVPNKDQAPSAGCDLSVFNAGTYEYSTLRTNVLGHVGVSVYSVALPELCEIVSVKSATLYEDDKLPVKAAGPNNLTFTVTSTYAHSTVTGSAFTTHPCTLDAEMQSALIEIPQEMVELIGKKDVTYTIVFEYVVRLLKGGIRINSYGDVFIDGRNVVVRSQNNKAGLGLFDDGKAVLNSKQTQIGDVLGGALLLNRGGVILSAGSSESGSVVSCGDAYEDPLTHAFGPYIYFYITGDLPLVRYDTQNNKFTLVTSEEYSLLDPMDKYRIYPRLFDKDDTVIARGAFTEKTLETLMAGDAIYPDYNTLRSL